MSVVNVWIWLDAKILTLDISSIFYYIYQVNKWIFASMDAPPPPSKELQAPADNTCISYKR